MGNNDKVLSPEEIGEIRVKQSVPQLCIFCEHFDASVDGWEEVATAHCAKGHYPVELGTKGIDLNHEGSVREAALFGLKCTDYIPLVNLDELLNPTA